MLNDTFVDADPYPRRHPVRTFCFRLFLVVVLAAVAGVVYVWHYQPLTNASTYGVVGSNVRETESAGGSSVVTYGAGESFEMIFSVRNTGPVTVRITGLPRKELTAIWASYDVTMMPRQATGYDAGVAEPFRPFALNPDEERLLVLSYTFKDCGEPANAGNRIIRRQAVRYELTESLRREADVALGQPIVITRMPAC